MSTKSFFGSQEVVFGSNAAKTLNILRSTMSSSKSAKLIVVSDFDHTLTKFTSLQCHDVVGYHKDFSTSFTEEYRGSFLLPFDSLSEWWRFTHDLIVDKSGLTKSMLQDRMDEGHVHARTGFGELAVTLRNNDCPFIIVSAGFKDIIHHTMTQCNASVAHDHLFHIDANYLEFSESGEIGSILPVEPVHSRCKHEVAVRAPHMFAFIQDSQIFESDITVQGAPDTTLHHSINSHVESEHLTVNQQHTIHQLQVESQVQPSTPVVAIVMGDRAPDFDVLSAFPSIQQFRIGFARTFADEDVQPLLVEGCCDVVLVGHEHGLEAVQQLIDELLALRSVAEL